MIDIAIIGSGPSGLSAAVNGKIRGKSVIVFGQKNLSDKLIKAPRIENYLGLYGISGVELAEKFNEHLAKMDISITEQRVKEIYPTGKNFGLLIGNDIITANKVIIATGVNFGKTLPGEKEYLGKGVGYCATCDASLYRNKDIVIVGYSAEAEEDVEFCKKICGKVTYIVTYDGCSLDGCIRAIPSEIVEEGDKKVLVCKDGRYVADGIFLLKDAIPPAQLCKGLVTNGNHIVVDRNMQTNISGLYACGDITGTPYQFSKAIGEGLVAGQDASKDR